jgi:hypothetical protein
VLSAAGHTVDLNVNVENLNKDTKDFIIRNNAMDKASI